MGVCLVGTAVSTHDAYVHDNIIRPNGTKRVLTHYGDFAAIMVTGTGGKIDIVNNDIEGTGYQGIDFWHSVPLTDTLEITDNTVKIAAAVGDGYGIIIGSNSNSDDLFEIARNTVIENGRGIAVEGSNSDGDHGPGNGSIHDNYVESRESHTPDPGGPGLSTGLCLRFGAHNIEVYNNTIKVYAGATAAPGPFPTNLGPDCYARGMKIHIGTYGRDFNIHDNTIVANTQDTNHYAGAIYAINNSALYGSMNTTPNVVFHNNTVTSNNYIVDLSESDGGGSYWTFTSNTFAKDTNPQAFHSIHAGYWTDQLVGNVFLDNTWTRGADDDDLVLSPSGGAPYSLYVEWYLTVTVTDLSNSPVQGASITATATGGSSETVTGTTSSSGVAVLTLTDYCRHGVTWPGTNIYDYYTPHSVTVSAPGYTSSSATSVTMDASKAISVVLAPGPGGTQGVRLGLAVDKSQAAPQETVTYTISFSNTGVAPAASVRIASAIPSGTTYVPGSTRLNGTPVAPDPVADGLLVVVVGTLEAGQQGTITFQVRVN